MALQFASGVTDRVDIGSAAILDNMDPFTVVALCDVGTLSVARVLMSKQTTTSNGWRIIRTSTNRWGFIRNGTSDWSYEGGTIVSGSFMWVAAVFDSGGAAGEQMQIYAGTLTAPFAEVSYTGQTDGSAAVDDSASPIEWGAFSNVGAGFSWGGRIVRGGIFPTALSLTDLLILQRADIAAWASRGPVDLHEFGLQFGTGTQTDLSGNGNHGTVTGATAAVHAPIRMRRPLIQSPVATAGGGTTILPQIMANGLFAGRAA